MSSQNICKNLRKKLELWSGYSSLSEAMRSFPEVDIYAAGGVVRDVLLGDFSTPKDFDFFLQGSQIKSFVEFLGKNGNLSSTPFGSPRWHPPGPEKTYADLIPIVDFAPGLWPCNNIIDVLNQFDFTSNAVAYDVRSNELFDPQNGIRDSGERIMKMVRFDYPSGPYIPSANLDRNVIMWFRITHYSSVLNFKIEPVTLEWILDRIEYSTRIEDFRREFFNPNLSVLEKYIASA